MLRFFGRRNVVRSLRSRRLVLNVETMETRLALSAPSASGGAYEMMHDHVLICGILEWSDPDGYPVTFSMADGPSNGTATVNSDGTFSYTPNAGYAGTDSFTFTTDNGTDTSDPATEYITVDNTPPSADDGSFELDPCDTVYGNVGGSDPDGDPVTFNLVSGPSHGTFSFSSDGSYEYTPDSDFVDGMDTFTFTAFDGIATSQLAQVQMNVRAPKPLVNISSDSTGELMGTTVFSITPNRPVTGATYTLQMKDPSTGDWVNVGSGATVSVIERVAGTIPTRAMMMVGAKGPYSSSEFNVTVQFPDADTIYEAPGVKAKMDQTWAATLKYADDNKGTPDANGNYVDNLRMEMGYWITLDTTTGAYGTIAFPTRSGGPGGLVLTNLERGGISQGLQPPDNPVNPTPGVGGVYVVAIFHTHTPMAYRFNVRPRPVGPSRTDSSMSPNLPGFVYDYYGDSSTRIGPGLPPDSRAAVWAYNADRRSID